MKYITLTKGQVSMVDDALYEELNQYKWYASYAKNTNSFYALRAVTIGKNKQRMTSMHRVIMGEPEGLVVDHIDHDTLNNTIVNLRKCTRKENTYNSKCRKGNKSGYKGVGWNNSKWRVQITKDGTKNHIGYFTCKHDAAEAYNEAAIKYHGDFAYQNVIVR